MPLLSYRLVNDQAQQQYAMGIESPQFVVMNKPHDAHPSLDHLVLLVFEAVMEVVCVSLPGYIIARLGHFDVEKQKFLANLNVMLFTPCLSTLSSIRHESLSDQRHPPANHETFSSLRSFYQARRATERRQAGRPSRDSSHLCHSDPCVVRCVADCDPTFRIQQESLQFRHCHGSMCNPS